MNEPQPQGGLNQVSQPPKAMPPAKPQPKVDQSADADRIAAEQVQAQDEPFDVNKEITNLNKGRMQLDQQIQKMQESLAKRQTLPYDPRLMALGIGLAQPTKTGNFAESLGQGMSEFHKATLGENERQQTNDTQNLDLMMKQQQLRQKLAGSAMLQNLGGPQGGAPAQVPGAMPGGGMPGGITAPVGGGAPAGNITAPAGGGAPLTSRPGLPTTVTGFAPIGRKELIAGQQIGDPDTEKFLFNLQKAEVEAKKAADAGFTEVTIPYNDKKVKVRTEVADGFFEAARQAAITGDENILVRFMAQNGMITPTGRKNAQGQIEYEKPKTALEEAQERERLTQTEKARAESSEKSAEGLKNRASVAFDNQQTAQDMISYAKNNPEVFRLLNTGKTRDVVMKALGAGIQTPAGSVNLPVNILKQQGLTDAQIDTLQMFAQSAAQLNIQFRKTMQGQGQITEKESQLAAELGAMPSDSDVVIRLKSELLMERSKFDDKAYGAWLEYRKTGKSYDEFMHSQPFKELKSEYSDVLKTIRENNAELLKKRPKAEPAAPAAPGASNAKPPAAPAKPLSPNDSSVPPGYIRDPQTGVIRKKREGE
jgi:hypothetical protein